MHPEIREEPDELSAKGTGQPPPCDPGIGCSHEWHRHQGCIQSQAACYWTLVRDHVVFKYICLPSLTSVSWSPSLTRPF
jgi:hypothetical protein